MLFVCLFVCKNHAREQMIGKEKRRNKRKHNQGMRGRAVVRTLYFAVIHSFSISTVLVCNVKIGKGFEP